jgi:glycerol-3-phosphate acyltransferase PlsY
MMPYVIALFMVILGYLSGSANYAIVVTWLVARTDIRDLGNRNAGTANVARNVGVGWAALVFFLDIFKGLGPMLLASYLLAPAGVGWLRAAVAAVGMAAILGHCKPVFFQFKGGGGIATSIGVFAFFVPIELVISLLSGFFLAMLFFRRASYTLGQWTPIMFLTILPFLTLATNHWLSVELAPGITLGGHPPDVPIIVFVIALYILAFNASLMAEKVGEIRA